ncbi:MAG: RNA polymerase sigma factor [Lutibacter sp.]|jgi:RNA polymerase sigma-70 factor (ECF subfamily)
MKKQSKKVRLNGIALKVAHKNFKNVEQTSENWAKCLKEAWVLVKNRPMLNFESVYNEYNKRIQNFINTKVKNSDAAQELCADVFIKVNDNLVYYMGEIAGLSTWIYSIAKNTIIDYYRVDKSSHYTNVSNFADAETGKETFQFVASESYETESVLDCADKSEKISKAFENLKPNYKKIALLYFIEDKQYNEIAEVCNIPLGTVKGMISRCREMLQNELKDVYSVKRTMTKA